MASQVPLVRPDESWRAVRAAVRDDGLAVVAGYPSHWPEGARRLALTAAGAALRRPPGALELGRAPGGRPYLRGHPELEVSLGHTRGLLVAAVSARGRVGVDVEPAGRGVYGTPLVAEMTTPYERSALAALPEEERNAALVRLWTRKEAYTKALGVGLRLPFTAFGLVRGPAGYGPRGPDGRPVDPSERDRWRFGTDPDVAGCVVSWAVRQLANVSYEESRSSCGAPESTCWCSRWRRGDGSTPSSSRSAARNCWNVSSARHGWPER